MRPPAAEPSSSDSLTPEPDPRLNKMARFARIDMSQQTPADSPREKRAARSSLEWRSSRSARSFSRTTCSTG